jgi:hypothetical protein
VDSHTWHHLRRNVYPRSREWACCMERTVVNPYVKSFIMNWPLHDLEDQVFVVDVVVTDPTWEMVALSVINWPTCATIEFSSIVKVRKYRSLHEGQHFILMAMEVHNTPMRDMDHFIKECAHFFHSRQSRSNLSLYFCIKIFKQRINIFFSVI